MKNKFILLDDIIKFVLMALFIYAALVKLSDVETFKIQMLKSPLLPSTLVPTLAYVLPILELAIPILLLMNKYAELGFLFAYGMMFLFLVYLVGLNVFYSGEQIPCSCGGILGKMPYNVHIIFNAAFSLLACIGYLRANNCSINSSM